MVWPTQIRKGKAHLHSISLDEKFWIVAIFLEFAVNRPPAEETLPDFAD